MGFLDRPEIIHWSPEIGQSSLKHLPKKVLQNFELVFYFYINTFSSPQNTMLSGKVSIIDTSRQPLGVVCSNVPVIWERKMRLWRYSLGCLPCWLYHIFKAKEGWPSFISLSVIKPPNHNFWRKVFSLFFLVVVTCVSFKLTIPGYSPSLWGRQSRILKQLVTSHPEPRVERNACMLTTHVAFSILFYCFYCIVCFSLLPSSLLPSPMTPTHY